MSVTGVDDEVYGDGEVICATFLPLVSGRSAPLRRVSEEQIKGLYLHQLLV